VDYFLFQPKSEHEVICRLNEVVGDYKDFKSRIRVEDLVLSGDSEGALEGLRVGDLVF
jgi:hypothetical protein